MQVLYATNDEKVGHWLEFHPTALDDDNYVVGLGELVPTLIRGVESITTSTGFGAVILASWLSEKFATILSSNNLAAFATELRNQLRVEVLLRSEGYYDLEVGLFGRNEGAVVTRCCILLTHK